jgi:hypothetical protein
MKVFLCWSGKTSHAVALAFHTWLPQVIQRVEPFMSSEDIEMGNRWNAELAAKLEAADFGIVCLTLSNLNARWLHFEAGALAKSVEEGRVSPFLFNLKPSDLDAGSPLRHFQATRFTKQDVRKLIDSINSRMSEAERLGENMLSDSFENWWPKLEATLKEIQPEAAEAETQAELTEPTGAVLAGHGRVLEEILQLVREQSRRTARLASSSPSAPARIVRGEPADVMEYVYSDLVHAPVKRDYLESLFHTHKPEDARRGLERLLEVAHVHRDAISFRAVLSFAEALGLRSKRDLGSPWELELQPPPEHAE